VSLRQGVEPAGNRESTWDGPRCNACRCAMTTRRPPFCVVCAPGMWPASVWPDPYVLPEFMPSLALSPMPSAAGWASSQPMSLETRQ
jgi:hypothetical protein